MLSRCRGRLPPSHFTSGGQTDETNVHIMDPSLMLPKSEADTDHPSEEAIVSIVYVFDGGDHKSRKSIRSHGSIRRRNSASSGVGMGCGAWLDICVQNLLTPCP
jgi:hypothetical protein